MAKPKSEDRRAALLEAAAHVFAENGLGASTASISAKANVSEGSFFTYFKTKDDLVNELYRDFRQQLADTIRADFPLRASTRERLEHVWSRYVLWGGQNPIARKALKLVSMSHVITETTRAESARLFAEVEKIQTDAVKQKKGPELPPEMASQVLKALAEMTMELIAKQPERTEEFRAAGFQMLWAALNSKP